MVMVNVLSELRADISNALDEAGIRSVDYAETKIVPPIAVVVPNDDYIVPTENSRFGHYSVGIQVMILGPKATASVAADAMDTLLVKAINVLDEQFDIVNVSAPGEANLNGVNYFGSVISIEAEVKLGKEN